MTTLPVAPAGPDNPLPVGTRLHFDRSLTISGEDVISGGHPWRITRLNGAAMAHLRAWEASGRVTASTGALARTLVDQGYIHPRFNEMISLHDVDVVVPVFDDVAGLERLLPQLEGFSVTVVDDASTSPVKIEEVCRRFGATYIQRSENGGPGAARNSGAAATSRPFVWFIDSDVSPGRLSASLARLSPSMCDPRVAAVAPRIQGEAGERSLAQFDERFGPLDLGAHEALVVPGGSVSYVPTASLLIRRSAFGAGFNESLRSAEDVDFVWRLHDAGWLVRYEPSVVMHHRPRATLRTWISQRESYGYSASRLAALHPGRLRPIHLDALTALTWLAVLAKRWRFAVATVDVSIDGVAEQLPASISQRHQMSRDLVLRGLARSSLPLARAIVRSYAPLLIAGLMWRRTRRIAGVIVVAGTFERLRRQPPRASDVALSLVDDSAYSIGLWRGAWHNRQRDVITPEISWSSLRSFVKRTLARPIEPSPSRDNRHRRELRRS